MTPQVQRDTNSSTDLGYHYPAADFLIGGCNLGGTNLAVAPGTDIAWFYDSDENGLNDAIGLNDGDNLSLNGTAAQPCFFAESAMIQEVGSFSGYNEKNSGSGAVMFGGSGNTNAIPRLSANFSKWTSDGNPTVLSDTFAWGDRQLQELRA